MSDQQALENYLELIEMRHLVRFGEQPDSPCHIQRWFELEEASFPRVCNCVKRRVYRRQYDLLIEAVMDDLVPELWRQLCLDYLSRPLNGLAAIAVKPQHQQSVQRLRREMRTQVRYSFQYR